MKAFLEVLTVAAMLWWRLDLVKGQNHQGWGCFRGNEQRNGSTTVKTGRDLGLLWSHDSHGGFYASPVLDSKGNIYLMDFGHSELLVLKPDGSAKFHVHIEGVGGSTLAIDEATSRAYVTTVHRQLVCIDISGGRVLWGYELPGGTISSPVIRRWEGSHTLIFLDCGHNIMAFRVWDNEPDPELVWVYHMPTGIQGSPSLYGDLVIMVSDFIYAVDQRTGEVLWKSGHIHGTEVPPAIASDGSIYVPAANGSLFCFNHHGEFVWEHHLGERGGLVRSGPALDPTRPVVYIGSDAGFLFSFNRFNGELQWMTKTAGIVGTAAPAVSGSGDVFMGCLGNQLRAYSGDTGQMFWDYTVGQITNTVAIAPGGVIYVASWDGVVLALDTYPFPLKKHLVRI